MKNKVKVQEKEYSWLTESYEVVRKYKYYLTDEQLHKFIVSMKNSNYALQDNVYIEISINNNKYFNLYEY